MSIKRDLSSERVKIGCPISRCLENTYGMSTDMLEATPAKDYGLRIGYPGYVQCNEITGNGYFYTVIYCVLTNRKARILTQP